jgi:F420-dependent oxidoreductase-like protein
VELAWLFEAIMSRPGPVRLVAIDGPGGSGKSTFAERLSKAAGNARIIHTDDFASADNPINWWPRLLRDVIEPLSQHKPARYQRYDWPTEAMAEWHTVEPTPIVIIEGVSSGRSEWAQHLSFVIWIETPRAIRLVRAVERDGHEALDDWAVWMAAEDAHYARDPTRERSDVVVDGTSKSTLTALGPASGGTVAASSGSFGLGNVTITSEPQQGATYGDLVTFAQRVEQLGFAGFFRSDHYLAMDVDGLPGPTDAWITLAGLARETSRIRLGTLVTSATFRLPGPLAISVAQVDQMSGGRVELGLGAGWYPDEHRAYGIPFPDTGERFDRFEEQLEVITGLWATPLGGTFNHHGRHYRFVDSPALPKPLQQPVPIIIGGTGAKRTPSLAARFANEFNAPFVPLDTFASQANRVRTACDAIGRAHTTLVYSAAVIVCIGATESDFHRRAAFVTAVTGMSADLIRQNCIAGTMEQARHAIEQWTAAGAQRLHLLPVDPSDIEHLNLLAAILT